MNQQPAGNSSDKIHVSSSGLQANQEEDSVFSSALEEAEAFGKQNLFGGESEEAEMKEGQGKDDGHGQSLLSGAKPMELAAGADALRALYSDISK